MCEMGVCNAVLGNNTHIHCSSLLSSSTMRGAWSGPGFTFLGRIISALFVVYWFVLTAYPGFVPQRIRFLSSSSSRRLSILDSISLST